MTNQISKPNRYGLPKKQGLYDPAFEKENCGVGFVADIKGRASHQIVRDADHINRRMVHRGACGCETNTGDGAGMLTTLPHKFLAKIAKQDLGVTLPEPGRYAAGIVFLPMDEPERAPCREAVEQFAAEQGLQVLGWRVVPVDADNADIGPTARAAMPYIEQLFVAAADGVEGDALERQLYLIRKRATHRLRNDQSLRQREMFYVCTLSTKVLVYKGMLNPDQVTRFYADLNDPDYETHLAMVHARFSTNTFPSWDRAQPNRFMSHNGEINTRQGNINWMHAREGVAKSDLFGDELEKVFPVIEPETSDSGAFDNTLEFLLMNGRSLQEAVMMMIPEAWQNDAGMSEAKRNFYEYNSALMEPWDGPASIVFTDGHYIGAVLDRNGLRPSRYYLTHDDKVIMASEVGVLEVDPANVKAKGRLQPGKMFLLDFEQGRMIPDEELKHDFASRQPYGQWLENQRILMAQLPVKEEPHGFDPDSLLPRMQAFGYTTETMQFMLLPLVRELRDPVGSMGNDQALACLSDKPRMLYDYFKQLFAQVTNPAIDSIREEVVMTPGMLHRSGRQSAGNRRRPSPSSAATAPDSHERRAGGPQAYRPSRLEGPDHRYHLRQSRRQSRSHQGFATHLRRSLASHCRWLQPGGVERSSDRRRPGRRQFPACGGRRAPPSGRPSRTYPDRHRARIRRSAGSAPALFADRLRRRRHQPVSGFRSTMAGAARWLAVRREIRR